MTQAGRPLAIYAKSGRAGRPGELLVDHLIATHAAVQELRHRVGTIQAADPVPGGLWAAAECAALAHDLGKVAAGFQDMVTGRSRAWGHRHELLSLGFLADLVPDPDRRLWIASAVLTHHRPLSKSHRSITLLYRDTDPHELAEDLGPIDPAAVAALHGWLAGILGTGDVPPPSPEALVTAAHAELVRVRAFWQRPAAAQLGLAAVLLQGTLTLADHLSSAHGTLHTEQPLATGLIGRLEQKFVTTGGIRAHQRQCAEISGHLLLRAPTGSGKTEAGLLWAARQVLDYIVDGRGVPRVVVTLPYLASINAMAGRLGDLLGDRDLVGVAHSRAASYHLAVSCDTDDSPDHSGARKAVSRAAATRLFRETVRVATPYQLLRAALAGPVHSGILVDLANSIIILDELHAYDSTRLGYILASAGLWEQLGCRIAVLSATLPAALAKLAEHTLRAPTSTVVGPSGPPRHRVTLRTEALTADTTLTDIANRVAGGDSVLVVANNVAQAQDLYERLGPAARDRYGERGAILLHSRFTRRDRGRIEQWLAERYRAGRTDPRPGLVVATQVVEVSLDIDLDALYTSAAPLEALLQRFGRVNRFGARPPADVVICPARYGPRRGQPTREYADGVYEAEPVRLAWRILGRHDGDLVDESAASAWLDEIYASPWGESWRADVDRARRRFASDMLTFDQPFAARDDQEEQFDTLFDGAEAVLHGDYPEYRDLLTQHPDRAGRLLGEQYLIPVPDWATGLARYDKELRVRIIDGDYDPEHGLRSVRPIVGTGTYTMGEVL